MFYRLQQSWKFFVVLALALTAVFTTKPTHAATLQVDPVVGNNVGNCIATPCRTIGYALIQAFAGDTINLAAGIYSNGDDYGLTINQEIVIRGAGPGLTIIDALGNDRHFTVTSGVPRARLRDLTLQNGLVVGLPGGSVLVQAGVDFDLINVDLLNNIGYDGGAVACQQCARLDINDSLFDGNSAGRFGGAIYTAGADVDINRSSIRNNDADAGGGIYKTSGRIILEDSAIVDNVADNGSGGGIYSLTQNLNIGRSLIAGNTATFGNGGGVYVDGSGVFKMFNSTVSGNSAAAGGGLSINDPIEARTSSNTFYGNAATFGNSGGAIQSNTNTDLLVANTIISSSTGNDCAISGLYPHGKHNFSDDASCYNVVPPVDFLLGSAVVGVDIDPVLQNNGGLTSTHMLPGGSAAIDQGALGCRHPTLGVPLVQDQRGTARPQGAACDVGAVEAQ